MSYYPLVSILVPLYNAEPYIVETLDSCINQTYRNIEVIVVDDGSKDKSLQVAKNYAQKHPQVNVYTQDNSGACRARNFAFEKSSGEYVMYLDADDKLSPNKIERQICDLREQSNTIVSFCEWGKWINGLYIPEKDHSIYKNYSVALELIETLLNGKMLQTSCWLVPRALIEKAGPWNECLLINQDGEFFLRVLANADRAIYTANCKVLYRYDNLGSITRSKKGKSKGYSLYNSYSLMTEYLDSKGILTPKCKYGLAQGFMSVAYIYIDYPDIVRMAKESSLALVPKRCGINIGSPTFRTIGCFIGFWNLLKLKQILKK